jgi:hypothetical protein
MQALSPEQVVVRRALGRDGGALRRLADLDSAPHPTGEMLLAEVDQQVVAAVPLDGGRAIADPFRHTASLVEQLRARADLIEGGGPPTGRRQRLHPPLPHVRIFA